jgi:tetratricopeptide (TPR) repeat protein
MAALQKLQLVAALGWIGVALPGAGQAVAQDGAPPVGPGVPTLPMPAPLPDASEPPGTAIDPAEREAELLAELAEPGRKDWERVETEIGKLWSRSGSPAMDLLLARGNEAIAEEDYPVAIEHLSALIDHAPDFAEGWNARATAHFLEGDFALAMSDVEHVLALNPSHFGALTGLAAMFEAMDEPRQALAALRLAEKLNPNRPSIKDAITRLEKQTGEVEL